MSCARNANTQCVRWAVAKANNILLADSGVSVFLDGNPMAPASAKYKMTCSTAVYGSPDGLHWTRLGGVPVHTMDDTKPTGNWVPALKRYVVYTRRWGDSHGTMEPAGGAATRYIGRCETRDFTDWDKDYGPAGCPVRRLDWFAS